MVKNAIYEYGIATDVIYDLILMSFETCGPVSSRFQLRVATKTIASGHIPQSFEYFYDIF